MTHQTTQPTSTDEIVLYGFQRSTYVNVARLVLHAKGVAFRFHDVEHEIGTPAHLKRHPFGRVPALQHGSFMLYETSAIGLYIEENFDGPPLLPAERQARALCHQWMSALSSYFYPYMIYYLVHERLVFGELGIAADEAVVAESLPKIELALSVMDGCLKGPGFLACDVPTLADYFLFPTLTALGFTPEGKELLCRHDAVSAWIARMGKLPAVIELRSTLPPSIPIEHARRWATEHRPSVREGRHA
ncbi:MAG: glutathione S-transferase family protein [Cytophagales bacterium]|nr:glutathione S-transferase family protein [Rhizobacter sp.]